MAAYIKTADLPTLSPNLLPPKPPIRKMENGDEIQACVTLSAGIFLILLYINLQDVSQVVDQSK